MLVNKGALWHSPLQHVICIFTNVQDVSKVYLLLLGLRQLDSVLWLYGHWNTDCKCSSWTICV